MAILSEHIRQTKTVADANGDHIKVSRWTHADTVHLSNGLTLDESVVYLKQADWDALGDEKYTNGVEYRITDATLEIHGSVVGVKGNAESSYRDGEVNITAENIGLGNVPNVATNDQTVTYEVAESNVALTSGEKINEAFGKIAKAVSSLISHLADKVSHITSDERAKWDGYETSISTLNSDKQDNLSYGVFTGNIDYVNNDGSNNHVRNNSIVWVTPGASGNLPGEYFVLETFNALNGLIVQKATVYIYEGLPIIKERIYCNETWSDWERYATNSDIAKINTVEKFEILSPSEVGLVTIGRQNNYKIGNRVHIEFMADATIDMAMDSAWGLIPQKYAPNYDTGIIGLLSLQTGDDFVTTTVPFMPACRVMQNNESDYGLVYQWVASNVKAGYKVGFMFDYFI